MPESTAHSHLLFFHSPPCSHSCWARASLKMICPRWVAVALKEEKKESLEETREEAQHIYTNSTAIKVCPLCMIDPEQTTSTTKSSSVTTFTKFILV